MKFSENWLRTFVDPPCSSDALAHLLTMAGLEVESIDPVAAVFDKVIVAEVMTVDKHPDADRLNVCQVNTGLTEDDGALQIVCGAPNVHIGMKVPCALVGARLPGFVIKPAKLRGVASQGMLCSAKELGLAEEADGLLLLPETAPVGADFRKYYGLDDKSFTLKLTPNRADCFGLIGIAREVAAITSTSLNQSPIKSPESVINDTLTVQVADPDACPLYCGRIIRDLNLNVPTPLWVIQRLERSGIRAINAIVDITNYVMLEMNQPMHAFDMAKVSGEIQVRYATTDEQFELLNGAQLKLAPDMLLIADKKGPLALAGIMGGRDSGVILDTTTIFLESAFFNPVVISGKSFLLGFGSDSSQRFERGVDFASTRNALEYATNLIVEVCGGKLGPVTEICHELPSRVPVKVRVDRVVRVLGIAIDKDQISEIFERLGFEFSSEADYFQVTPPTYRFDLLIEEDFIEELARIYGYDHIVAHSPHGNLAVLPVSESKRTKDQLQLIMAARDYQEVINYSFVDAAWEADFTDNKKPVGLRNPIASQMSVMRSSLTGGLIANLKFNLNRKQSRVRLFEVGRCFISDGDGHIENEHLAGLCYGDAQPEQWGVTARNIDFYDVKADIEALCWPSVIRCEANVHPALHPGKSAQIFLDNKIVGWIGELHPRWQKKYGLSKTAVLFELDLSILEMRALPVVKEITKYPSIRRDIAVIVSNKISANDLLASMNATEIAILSEVTLFDMYSGKGMTEGKKSLAFRVLLQDTEKTLTDEDADAAILKLINILECQFDAKLRN